LYEDIGAVSGHNHLVVSPGTQPYHLSDNAINKIESYLIGSQWRKDRKLIGAGFRSRSYFQQVLSRSNAVSVDVLKSFERSVISCSEGANFIDHHEEILAPAALKISAG
jgi:hypothetical protein